MRQLLRHLAYIGVALAVAIPRVQAQVSPRGLDAETLHGEAASVYHVWQRYLASKNGHWSANAGSPTSDWRQSEQRRWPVYDLAGFYTPNGATPEIASVEPTESCGRPGYRITTRFRSDGLGPSEQGTVTETVYAVRDADRWVLANALPYNTCTWRRSAVGPVTYVFAPDYPFDAARARRAVAFTDSLAAAFSLPRLDSLTYYLAHSIDEMYAILGLELAVKYGPGAVAGLAQPINHQLFSGSPRIGEDYRHELAHLILAPLCCAATSYLVSEGVATWIGGTSGVDFRTAARGLAAFLNDHPSVTLDSVLSGSYENSVFYSAGAVLVDMGFEHDGVTAVKALFSAGGTPAELRLSLERQFGQPWSAIASDWRHRAAGFAKPLR